MSHSVAVASNSPARHKSSPEKKRKRDRDAAADSSASSSKHHSKHKSERRHSSGGKEKEKHRSKSKHQSASQDEGAVTAAGKAAFAEPQTAFETMYPVISMPIPPLWTNDPLRAVAELLDTMVMRYVPQLGGVLLTHIGHLFLDHTAVLDADSAFAVARSGFECTVWRPCVGMRLVGKISLSSPSHVSLLLHGTFNASISANHLPPGEYEFVYDETVDEAQDEHAETEVEAGGEENGQAQEGGAVGDKSLGYWRRLRDGARLGGQDGRLDFTVISMTIANNMLSLHGSLLSDPFAVPPPTPAAYETALPQHSSTDANGRAAAPPGGFRVRFEDQEPSDESDDDEDLPDPRAMLPPSVGAESVGDGKNGEEKRKKKDKMERKRSKKDTASASESEGESATPKKKRRKTQDA